jgi:protein involved in ribonucleotide reduction
MVTYIQTETEMWADETTQNEIALQSAISDNNREFIEIPGIEVIHVQNRQHAEQWIIEEVVTNGYLMPIIGISNKGGPCKKTCRPLVDEYNVPYVYSTEGVGTKHIEYRSGE